MAGTKSFQQILREKMTKNGGFSEGPISLTWPNFTLKTVKKEVVTPMPLEDLLLGKIDISNRPSHFSPREKIRETWFSLYKKEYEKYLIEETITETPKIPLEKRLWSESQQQAIDVLKSFGAEELSDFSSDGDIKKAFRSLAKRYHPDTLVNQPESIVREKSQQFILIHKSYKELIGSCGT